MMGGGGSVVCATGLSVTSLLIRSRQAKPGRSFSFPKVRGETWARDRSTAALITNRRREALYQLASCGKEVSLWICWSGNMYKRDPSAKVLCQYKENNVFASKPGIFYKFLKLNNHLYNKLVLVKKYWKIERSEKIVKKVKNSETNWKKQWKNISYGNR